MKTGFVYIMSNYTRTTLYTGVTADLKKRVAEHKSGAGSVFTTRYNCKYLLYYEMHPTIEEAIKRETRIKGWYREWKENLIKSTNPQFKDLWGEL